MHYNPNEIEPKWQKKWRENQIFKAENQSEKPKYYILDMFPYPSGAGLHVGHPLGYIASDIYARYKRHQGFNVLHPMGYDSFGLPAEQYAIQTGQHPAVTTQENITRYRKQLDKIGFSFDWEREVRTSNPDYYRWTQWVFLQLFDSYYDNDADKAMPIQHLVEIFKKEGNQNVNASTSQETIFSAEEWKQFSAKEKSDILLNYRLTYLAEAEVNWCPALGTVLANDEVINGVSERGGHPVERKKMTQWMMRITAYAERLLNGISCNEEALDWSEALKESQKNWIGKSKGAKVEFCVQNSEDEKIEVFTTRPDTIFGVSFLTLAPEHKLVTEITTKAQREEVENYITETAKRSERERMANVKHISGAFTGAYALHPFTGNPIPIWISDYVLSGYGTGAVMAVPAGDERDYAFAQYFGLEIPSIFEGIDVSEQAFTEKSDEIKLQNSEFLNGLNYTQATEKIIEAIEAKNLGEAQINYRLRDAVFSRQRYWGEPVPMYFKNGIPTPIPTEKLPLELPEINEYLPTETGEPPLGRATQWAWDESQQKVVENSKIDEENVFPIEMNTMPGWAGSSWYLFRYMDSQNATDFADKSALDYWQNVDLYIGGSEHATGHLLYARFWTKFLKDRGFVQVDEPFKKLVNQGMILGNSAFAHRVKDSNQFVSNDLRAQYETIPLHVDVNLVDGNDALDTEKFKNWRDDLKNSEFILSQDSKFYVSREVEKMSKSKFNVVNPDDICAEYGADTLRMYEMFLGPIEQSKPWNTNGLSGVFGFLKKYWNLFFVNDDFKISEEELTKEEFKILHKLIKKVTEDITQFSFNTSISAFMIAVNDLQKIKCNKRSVLEPLTILLSPFAPHITEEIWEKLGHSSSISTEKFPEFEEKYLTEDSKEYPISFNGKMRFTLELPMNLSKEEIEKAVMEDERTQKYLEGRTPKKVIIVPGKIVNLVG
ncbi:Leucine--tRNA ligase [Candidatus Ornithobacterium hominis]|uniref:leucine--tRNA ligase n=1 Tax=Candidatus Ornithobacterium hominis TaxID=2497989 RepID=UPI000E5AEE8B|nr:leucine--tRNA ligase [Candidatus Ornithobacterium hominis]SZD71960.1 Leucine--tRNA ligase [Candidatus Ornithobacterium hominis]